MNLIEDYEGLSDTRGVEGTQSASRNQLDYVEEIVPLDNPTLLVERIDELSDANPPKAIDADKSIAEVIEPMKDSIPNIYLEAPSDSMQIEQISSRMEDIEGLEFNEWKELAFEDRVNVLQKLEDNIADIAHRPSCQIFVQDMPEGQMGYFDPESKTITVNSKYIQSNDFSDYKENLDTIVHEGRHAYQNYNVTEREIHSRSGEVTNWKRNENEWGYQCAELFGFEAYEMQPVEADARAFAEDVLKKYLNG